ncbi:MAG: EamA family transporter RarD, partial [Planctomycetota bacterium]
VSAGGLTLGISAHCLWGMFPLFWNLLEHVRSEQLACHRIVWVFATALLIVGVQTCFMSAEKRAAVWRLLRTGDTWKWHAFAAVMVASNWFAFLFAVNNGNILESSLGYYINPLVNVGLGVLFLGERLYRGQWFAIGLAVIGVGAMTIYSGGVPFIALIMAFSFGFYGLAKKKTKLDAVTGLLVEMIVLLPATLVYLMYLHANGMGELGRHGWNTDALIVIGGLVTLTPLAMFAAAAHRLPLSVMGILQYIGPTLQFLIAVVLRGEAFGIPQIVGFSFVWAAVLLFMSDVFLRRRRASADLATTSEA